MPDEKTDKKNAGDVVQQTGTETVVDGQQQTTQDAAGNQDEVTGLKAAAEAERKKRQDLEAQIKLQQDQMALIQANPVQQQVQAQQPLSDYDQAKTNLGIAGEDYIDESQRGAIYTEVNRITNIRTQRTQGVLANQRFMVTHSDYSEVVGRQVGNQMVPSAEITEILQRKPYLNAAAYASAEGAYNIVMQERQLKELEQKNTVNEEHLQQNQIDNKTAPVSGAAALR